jgi:cobalt/nickel transport system permease protein
MTALSRALDDLRTIDALSARDTALRQRDPRAQLVTAALFIVTLVSFERYSVSSLLPLALYPTVLAAQGMVPGRLLVRMLWRAAPFALMVGLFNPLFDRAPMLVLAGIDITGGWLSFTSIVIRFGLSLGAALVLIAGTGLHPLCTALARLGAPRAFVVQLLFLYRYLFVLAGEAVRATTARTLRGGAHPRMALTVYGSLLGQLLLRAFARAQRVHGAMLARGFDGELRLASTRRWQGADTQFVVLWCAYFIAIRRIDWPQLLGTVITGAIS